MEADKGKLAYYAICYENGKEDMGLWSPVEKRLSDKRLSAKAGTRAAPQTPQFLSKR
jgi:hypothetical protein